MEPSQIPKIPQKKHLALTLSEEDKHKARQFAEEYLQWLKNERTERQRVDWARKLAEEKGFIHADLAQPLPSSQEQKTGGDSHKPKLFYEQRGKAFAFAIPGKKSCTEGFTIIGTHVDTPHLDLRMHPFAEARESGMCFGKIIIHGGIKKYHWLSRPLYLIGTVIKSDGTIVKINIGQHPEDPVLVIPDLLIHLWVEVQSQRKAPDIVKAREMKVVMGTTPCREVKKDCSSQAVSTSENKSECTEGDAKMVENAFYLEVLRLLQDRYGVTEEDLSCAELSLVTGEEPRFVGLDSGLIGGAGQDDGVCTYCAVRAMFDNEIEPEHPIVVVGFDREETGSDGESGAASVWLDCVLLDLMKRYEGQEPSQLIHRVACLQSLFISADVTACVNPAFPSVQDIPNAAVAGCGIGVVRVTGGRGKGGASEASTETMNLVRRCLDKEKVAYQMVMLGELENGGGGTIAKFLANRFGAQVIDMGTGVISMHSPFELTHVLDVWSTYCAYGALLRRGHE